MKNKNTRCGFTQTKNSRHAELVSASCRSMRGFTLIELLVVILIIGILAAIAVPQYQKAVMKSRYSAMMPIAKQLANGNEIYYMEHGDYATLPQDLEVEGRAEYAEGTKVTLGADIEHAYVLASSTDELPKNKYIVYQNHSVNYPGEIHCEALKNDTQAAEVCKSFGATENKGPILTSTHDTWLLKGSGDGFPPGYSALLASISCDKAENMGYSCHSTVNDDGTATKRVCQSIEANGQEFCTLVYFDEDGNKTKSAKCTMKAGGVCYAQNESFYDENGNLLSVLKCYSSSEHNADGSCKSYYCGSNCYVYTYDKYDNMTSVQTCSAVSAADPTRCSSWYVYGAQVGYVYEDGLLKRQTRCSNGSTVDEEGKCSDDKYEPWNTAVYEYDDDGRISKKTLCRGFDDQGTCMPTISPYNYTYGSDGSVLEVLQGYSSGSNYTYDTQGNKTSKRDCERISNGVCTRYYGDGYYWDYDQSGNVTSYAGCQLNTDGTCASYTWRYNNTYDDAGNYIYTTSCNGSSLDAETGECIGTGSVINGYLTPKKS